MAEKRKSSAEKQGRSAENNYIFEYYEAIRNGSIVVGHWMMLLLEFLINGLSEKRFFYSSEKADEVIDWIETHCFHTEGPLAPQPLKLELWEKVFVATIYGIVDERGFRQFREVVLIVSRKNGKSLLAAAIAKYEWQCGGYGSKVYNIAPKLAQADIIYSNVWQMTTLDPEYIMLKEELSEKDMHNKNVKDNSILPRHRMSDLFIPALNASVMKIAFSAKKSDGFNPSFCACDEVAAWEGDAGLKQYEVMKSGMGARPEAILLSCTTSGYVNDGIYDELLKRCTRFLLGNSKEKRLLPFLYMIDDIEKWNDLEELRKSNPNLGVSVSREYLLDEIAVAEGSLSKKAEFITKYCNLKQNSSLAWLDAHVIEKMTGDTLRLEDFRSSYCVAGVDLSQTTDLTAATVVIEKNSELYVFAKFWLPAEKIDEAIARDGVPYNIYVQRGLLELAGENYVDYKACYEWLKNLIEQYEILPLKVGYDRYSAQYLVQDLESYGFQCDDVYQGDNLWGVLQEMEGLFKDGKVHIGDNDLLKIHLLNSAVKMSTERGRGKLVKISPTAHIDGVAALADAFCVRQKWNETIGIQLRNE